MRENILQKHNGCTRIEIITSRVFIITLACVVGFLILEIATRVYLFSLASPEQFLHYASGKQLQQRYGIAKLTPHLHLGWWTTPNYQNKPNKHNSLGFRGDEIELPKPPGIYQIVCLGGSTTYSDGVKDYTVSYPAMLERYFHEKGILQVNVVNAGGPGYSSLESRINLALRVLELTPDMLIIYHGINDTYRRFVWPPEAYRADGGGFIRAKNFLQVPSIFEYSTLLRTLMVKLELTKPHSVLTRYVEVPDTNYVQEFSRQKREGIYPDGIFTTIPAHTMLETNPPIYFEQNVRRIIAIAYEHEIDVLLVTFAHFPLFPEAPHLTSPEYQRALAENNQILTTIAFDTHAYLFDLAKILPTDIEYYTDGIHFTEAGNRLRARLIGEFLLEQHLIPAK